MLTKAADLCSLPKGAGVDVDVAGVTVCLFRTEDGVFAVEPLCPHRDAPLSAGRCDGARVTCPWHNAHFELATGRHLNEPGTRDLRTYPVELIGGEVFVDVPGRS